MRLQVTQYLLLSVIACLSLAAPALSQAEPGEFSGWLNAQNRYYFDTAEQVDEQNYLSTAVRLNYAQDLGSEDQLVGGLFLRYDAIDDERTHADIRELLWLHNADAYQLRAGIGQVSWGVTELFKITDIINQRDNAELPMQRKLGQPLVGISFYWNEDLIELYTLYGLRKTRYPGTDGRLRGPITINNDDAIYDYGNNGRVELAGRWKTRGRDADISITHFYGMTRAASFIFNSDFAKPYLIPVYEKINQTSIAAIYPWGDSLLKLEATNRSGSLSPYQSIVAGFEYAWGALFESNYDLTLYVEALWDSRDQIDANPFDHDIGLAARIAFNDAGDSNLIFGLTKDYEYNEGFGYLFFVTNFDEHWSLNITGQYFVANEPRMDPRNFEVFVKFSEAVKKGNYPLPEEIIKDVRDAFANEGVSKPQYDLLIKRLNEIKLGNGLQYFNQVNFNTVPQTMFDLLRVSNNRQKLNLIERDSYLQFDLYYHF